MDKHEQLRSLHLFAGAGGGILGDLLLGHRPVCAVEIEPYCQQVLAARMRDGLLPWFPIWDDVRTFQGAEWRGRVDIVAGGFPCQDISGANTKAEGLSGKRSGLWFEMLRVISEVRPAFVLVENSPILLSRGIDTVLGGLAALGYDARWAPFTSASSGAAHKRERIFVLAYAPRGDVEGRRIYPGTEHQAIAPKPAQWVSIGRRVRLTDGQGNRRVRRLPDSGVLRVVDEMAAPMDRLRAIGNGQDPVVVELAWRILSP